MSQSLIKTDVKKLVQDLAKNRGSSTSDQDLLEYLNYLLGKEKQPKIDMDKLKQYMEG